MIRAALLSSGFIILVIVGLPLAASGQTPRTPWGDPDLQGTYTSDNSIGVPFERPQQFGTRALLNDEEYARRVQGVEDQIAIDQVGTPFDADDPASINAPRHWLERPATPSRASSLVVDPPNGRIPAMTPEGQQRMAERRAQRRRGPAASYTDFSNYDRCISRGVAGSMIPVIYGNGTQIHQAPGVVVIRNEMIHEARVIPLDGSPHVGEGVKMWMGDSRGHWDGDTLVIETGNFTDRTGIGANGGGNIHSEQLRLVERLTRVSPDTIQYQFTVDDPVTYTAPWTVAFTLDVKPDYEIFEYACHEGNYGLAYMLMAARSEEGDAAERGR